MLWRVASIDWILDSAATRGWILVIGRHTQVTPVLNSNRSSHPYYAVQQCGLWLFASLWTHFAYHVSVYSIQEALPAILRSVSGLSTYLEIRTFSILFAKPGLMADMLLILAMPSFRSLWLFTMSMHSFSPNCWSRSWVSQDLLKPFTLRLLMNSPKANCMTCAMYGMWFLNEGHSIAEASRVDCS